MNAPPAWMEEVREDLARLVAAEPGREVCALVAALPEGTRLVALRAVGGGPAAFAVPECEWARVERWLAARGGRALCFVHSHPSAGGLEPSEADRSSMARHPELPWVIVAADGHEVAVGVPPAARTGGWSSSSHAPP